MKPTDAERDLAFERLIARGLEGETDVTGRACPDADLLAAWFDRSLSAPETERIEAHASGCASCQQILADLARSEPEVVRAAPQPAPARPWHWHWRWLVPAATAAVVIVLATRPLRAPGPYTRPPDWPTPAPSQQAQAGAPAESQAGGGAQLQVPPPAKSTDARESRQAPARRSAAPSDAERREMARREESGVGRLAANSAAPPPAAVLPSAPVEGGVVPDRKAVVAQGQTPERLFQPAGAAGLGPAASGAASKPATADTVGRIAESVTVASPERVVPPPPPAPSPVALRVPTQALKAESRVATIPAVSFSPGRSVAWRVGQAGSIERSSDDGRTWGPQSSGVAVTLAAASAVSDSICWAVGAGGTILRTTDGATWQPVTPPTGSDLVLVRASSRDAATVRALDGSEYSTSDGGTTWTKRQR